MRFPNISTSHQHLNNANISANCIDQWPTRTVPCKFSAQKKSRCPHPGGDFLKNFPTSFAKNRLRVLRLYHDRISNLSELLRVNYIVVFGVWVLVIFVLKHSFVELAFACIKVVCFIHIHVDTCENITNVMHVVI